ncbi:hypothetical protein [Kribbella orskensis]|uniref:hypothetical protein n=1 Tax=Kribbella orskensis TaxID=2512216 RepID=UPI00104D2DD9|nr:hypothetical protein [Kribbella orskensis]
MRDTVALGHAGRVAERHVVAGFHGAACLIAASTPSVTNVNGAVSAYSQFVGASWVTTKT